MRRTLNPKPLRFRVVVKLVLDAGMQGCWGHRGPEVWG